MKKTWFVAIILFVNAIGVGNTERLFAQNIHLGIRDGLSIPSLRGGNSEESRGYTSRLGADFGTFADVEFTRHLALEIEVLYVGQGGIKKGIRPISSESLSGLPVPSDMTLYADFKNETILNYIEIPLLAKYSFGLGKSFTMYVDGGPNIGILVEAKTKTSGSSQIFVDASGTPLTNMGQPLPAVDFTSVTGIKDDLNKLNFGIAGGMGISRNIGSGELSLDVRGSYGLSNIQKGSDNGENHTGCLVITLGYAIKI